MRKFRTLLTSRARSTPTVDTAATIDAIATIDTAATSGAEQLPEVMSRSRFLIFGKGEQILARTEAVVEERQLGLHEIFKPPVGLTITMEYTIHTGSD